MDRKGRIVATVIAGAALSGWGCKREGTGAPAPTVIVDAGVLDATAAASATASVAPCVNVADAGAGYVGIYKQFARSSLDPGGKSINPSNNSAAGVLVVEAGKVTWTQTFDGRTIVEEYAYTGDRVKAVDGGYDVALAFTAIRGDVNKYAPDSVEPRLEVRKVSPAWQVVLSYRDTGDRRSHVVFRP